MENPLEKLKLADPETWELVRNELAKGRVEPDRSVVLLLVENTLWGLTVEISLGRSLAISLARLVTCVPACWVALFLSTVKKAARSGATLAKIHAQYLAPVIAARDKGLLRKYNQAVDVMLGKGSYTLPETLRLAARLVDHGRLDDAGAYFDLLAAVFGKQLTYNRSMRLVYQVPKAVAAMRPASRCFQIRQMIRLVDLDVELADDYIQGLERGLALLGRQALAAFLDRAVCRLERSRPAGRRFLALEAADARQVVRSLQTAVDLAAVKGRLDNYLRARTGLALSVGPMAVPESGGDNLVSSGRQQVLLADPLDLLPDYQANLALAKTLVRLEACYYEFGTFELDLEKAADRHGIGFLPQICRNSSSETPAMELFCRAFAHPALAADLMTLFEHLRILRLAAIRYPGLMRRSMPFLRRRAEAISRRPDHAHPLWPLYRKLVLGLDDGAVRADCRPLAVQAMEEEGKGLLTVEDSAGAVWRSYRKVEKWLQGCRWLKDGAYEPMVLPFGWRVDWRGAEGLWPQYDQRAAAVKDFLDTRGIKVYRSDIKKLLVRTGGRPSGEQLAALVPGEKDAGQAGDGAKKIVLAAVSHLKRLMADPRGGLPADGPVNGGPAFYYPEWDSTLQDYLHGHVRVQERNLPAAGGAGFYRQTLREHGWLVTRVRAAFERLKPEGLARLRPWYEGDALDYRALIEFAVDRRTRRQASDRIFIKRLKQQRDVAVLLLVDMSRSTANTVARGQYSVLEVEKQALVVFCEALEVAGDNYAIAGFSGTGPLAVDFFRIKDFGQPLDRNVKAGISAMAPQRNTRMGAALRHATSLLARVPARVRLLIVIGDGFPNDLDYKHDYAIADTRRAVQEAGSRRIHVRAVTVNMGSDPRLDDLYGRRGHYVIEDVLDLPDKLVRVYSTLTRY